MYITKLKIKQQNIIQSFFLGTYQLQESKSGYYLACMNGDLTFERSEDVPAVSSGDAGRGGGGGFVRYNTLFDIYCKENHLYGLRSHGNRKYLGVTLHIYIYIYYTHVICD